MIVSIPNTITEGRISTYISSNYNAKQAMWGGAIASPFSCVDIAMVTDALDWGYTAGQNANNVRGLANYAIWMYGKYGLQAQYIMAGGGGGSVIPIVPGGGGGGTDVDLVRLVITNANLDSGNAFNDPRIVGKNIHIFISGYNEEWLYAPDAFTQTSTGIIITAPAFDPSNFQYKIIIQEYVPVAGVITTLDTPINFVLTLIGNQIFYTWDAVPNATGYTWQLSSALDFSVIVGSGTVTTNSFLSVPQVPFHPFYFRVFATAIGYANSAYGYAYFTPGPLTTPTLSFTDISATGFRTVWPVDANANAFFIDIATDPAFTTIINTANGSNSGSYLFGGGTTGTTYYVRVKQVRDPAWFSPSAYGTGSQATT